MATNNGKKKKDDCCCGKTVTETNTTVTEYGTNGCHMPKGTLQYVGARYVPVFADPVEWSADRPYEHLMMVQNQGNTYISKQAVPVGIPLPSPERSNDYWVLMSDWNAQIEQYREEVELFDGRITQNAEDIADTAHDLEVIANKLPADSFSSTVTVAGEIRKKADVIKKAVLIGDSYLREYSGNNGWGTEFETQTGFQCTRFKAGGAGFVRPGDVPGHEPEAGLNFVGMIDKAGTTIDEIQRNQMDYVVCVGGINDLQSGKTESEIRSAVNNFCNKARGYFPNARIFIAMPICSHEYMGNNTIRALLRNLQGTITGGANIAYYSNTWFQTLDWATYNRGDDIHPSNTGYAYLGKLLARAVFEPELSRPYSQSDAVLNAWAETVLPGFSNWAEFVNSEIAFRDGTYYVALNMRITNAAAMPSGATYMQLPIITSKSLSGGSVWVDEATLSDSTDGYSFFPFGVSVSAYDTANASNVRIRVNPSFKKLSDNTTIQYADGNTIHYNFTLPG